MHIHDEKYPQVPWKRSLDNNKILKLTKTKYTLFRFNASICASINKNLKQLSINYIQSIISFRPFDLDQFFLNLNTQLNKQNRFIKNKYSNMGSVCCEGCERVIKDLRGEAIEIGELVVKKKDKQPFQGNVIGHHGQTDSLHATYNSQQQEIDIRNTLLAPPSHDSGIGRYPSLNQSARDWDPYVPSPQALPQVQQQGVDLSHPFFMRNYGNEVTKPVVRKTIKKAQSCEDIKPLKRSSIDLQRTPAQTFNPIKSAI